MKVRAVLGVIIAILGVAIPTILVMFVFSPAERVSSTGPKGEQQLLWFLITMAIGLACGVVSGLLMRSASGSLIELTSDIFKRFKSLHV